MNISIILTSLGATAAAGIAIAQPADHHPMGDPNADITRQQVIERVDGHFRQMDANNDGRFTREEAQAQRVQLRARHAERMFARLDANNDGSISRQEFAQRQAHRGDGPGHGAGASGQGGDGMAMHHRGGRGGHGGMRMHGGRMFGEQGYVTAEQLRERALAHFDRLDADRNGIVTAAERRQAHQQRRGRIHERQDSDG